jgi:hypothetical protein
VMGLRESGLTYEAIARQVGLSANGVMDICKRYAAKGLASEDGRGVGGTMPPTAFNPGRPRLALRSRAS